jgi:hypothetical protein
MPLDKGGNYVLNLSKWRMEENLATDCRPEYRDHVYAVCAVARLNVDADSYRSLQHRKR